MFLLYHTSELDLVTTNLWSSRLPDVYIIIDSFYLINVTLIFFLMTSVEVDEIRVSLRVML